MTKQIETSIDVDAGALTFAFADGASLSVRLADLTDEMRTHAALHGLKQKIGDAGALSRNPDTGRSASIADKRDAMRAVLEQVVSGTWNRVGGGGGPRDTLTVRALVRVTGKTREEVIAWLEGKSRSDRAKITASPRIAQAIADLRAEDAAEGADSGDDLLADLMGDDAPM